MNPTAFAPPTAQTPSRAHDTVARAIAYLQQHAQRQPGLQELAAAVHLSPDHLQRLFVAWAGVSPKRFVQYLTKAHALQRLRADEPVLSTSLAVGLSGPARLHELLLSWEAMTPGEVRTRGKGLLIQHGWGETPFGAALIGWTGRGICHLAFLIDQTEAQEAELEALWPRAHWRSDPGGAQALLQRIFSPAKQTEPLSLLLRGSPFQLQVWQALLRLPSGHLVSYQTLAHAAGHPGASRAVGSAMAANTVGYLMPCHRVLRSTGESGAYRWGPERKLALQGWEAARRERLTSARRD